MVQRNWRITACLSKGSWLEVETIILPPSRCASVRWSQRCGRPNMFKASTIANSWCYKEGKFKSLEHSVWQVWDDIFMGRSYPETKAIWSQFSYPTLFYSYMMELCYYNFLHTSCLWERISEINRILKRKWFPCAVHHRVTIPFFQFHKMGYFFLKWHDSDATHCHLSFWWQKSSHSWITDITETHKNVLTFLTHNDIGLIVSILNLSKNICEKIVQWLSHKWPWFKSKL